MNELDLDWSDNDTIKSWALGTLKIKMKLKKYPQCEIRIFLMVKDNVTWKPLYHSLLRTPCEMHVKQR